MNKTVLVTGGAGYIGSHTCQKLKLSGFYPVIYDSLINGFKENVQWGPLVIGDLLDTRKLSQVCVEYQPGAVMHFAALLDIDESLKNPARYYQTNVAGTINLLQVMLKQNVKEIIFSSSSAVYGISQENLLSENQRKDPINPYATSKLMAEKVIEDFAYAYGIKYMILRYFNAAGMDVASRLKRPATYLRFLIPRALQAILDETRPLPIFGTDYATEDGTAIRDYIHVTDLAQAHVLALQHLQKTQKSSALNLGTGKGHSVYKIIQAVEEVTGKKVPCVSMPRKPGDVCRAVADVSLSKTLLHFEPHYSDLHTIIESEWQALQKSYKTQS